MTQADLLITNVRVADVFTGAVRHAAVAVRDGRILGFGRHEAKETFDGMGRFLLPGLIDSHVHIESSMLSPAGFAALVLPFGTTTVIADPHEMANVRGEEAVIGLAEAVRDYPLDVRVMAPSCVPALPFEDSGATLDADAVERLLEHPDIFGLGEMMNVPGLVDGDPEPNRKVAAALRLGKPVDGHAPLATGRTLQTYAAKGVMTDHECTTREELAERLSVGMYVSIREGSLARDLLQLVRGLPADQARRCTFCTDDRHAADTLERGHINGMLAAAVRAGVKPADAIRMATLNAAECYGLKDRGAIAPGRRADLILVDDLESFRVSAVWTKGRLVARNGRLTVEAPRDLPGFLADTVHVGEIDERAFDVHAPSGRVRFISLLAHSLITLEDKADVKTDARGVAHLADNPGMIKLAVVERHRASGRTGTCFLDPRYGLRGGAVATSVSHDSHNIVVAGDSESDMLAAVKAVEAMGGGIAMVSAGEVVDALALPVAGLMSDRPPEETAAAIRRLTALARERFGISPDSDAFMTLSFLALPVIPHLKLTARGLFDVGRFEFVPNDAGE